MQNVMGMVLIVRGSPPSIIINVRFIKFYSETSFIRSLVTWEQRLSDEEMGSLIFIGLLT